MSGVRSTATITLFSPTLRRRKCSDGSSFPSSCDEIFCLPNSCHSRFCFNESQPSLLFESSPQPHLFKSSNTESNPALNNHDTDTHQAITDLITYKRDDLHSSCPNLKDGPNSGTLDKKVNKCQQKDKTSFNNSNLCHVQQNLLPPKNSLQSCRLRNISVPNIHHKIKLSPSVARSIKNNFPRQVQSLPGSRSNSPTRVDSLRLPHEKSGKSSVGSRVKSSAINTNSKHTYSPSNISSYQPLPHSVSDSSNECSVAPLNSNAIPSSNISSTPSFQLPFLLHGVLNEIKASVPLVAAYDDSGFMARMSICFIYLYIRFKARALYY